MQERPLSIEVTGETCCHPTLHGNSNASSEEEVIWNRSGEVETIEPIDEDTLGVMQN
jgi:hypothetical protein